MTHTEKHRLAPNAPATGGMLPAALRNYVLSRLQSVPGWRRASRAALLDAEQRLTVTDAAAGQRLYSAGLFTIDTVAASDPADVAAVTGIPLNLAEEVVDATRRYASAERMRFLEELREGAVRLRRMLAVVPDDSTEFRTRATSALEEVERTLQTLKVPETP